MNLVMDLEDYYGEYKDDETKMYIARLEDELDEESYADFMFKIKKEHSQNFGMPDIAKFEKVKATLKLKVKRKFAWSVCEDCGCEYDYSMYCCPDCYSKGYMCTAKSVKISDNPPPMKIKCYNHTFPNNAQFLGGTNCYECANNFVGKCDKFGWSGKLNNGGEWRCREERDCPCRACCIRLRKLNESLESMQPDVTPEDSEHKFGVKIK